MKNRKGKDVVIPGAERNRQSTVKQRNITSLTAGLPVHAGNDSKRAFTLIELLVVVLIIGILAAVALPQYEKTVEKARMTEAILAVESIAKAQDLFYLANGNYTQDINQLEITYHNLPDDLFGDKPAKKTNHFLLAASNMNGEHHTKAFVLRRDSELNNLYALLIKLDNQKVCYLYTKKVPEYAAQLCREWGDSTITFDL